jgi:hypothetical protein
LLSMVSMQLQLLKDPCLDRMRAGLKFDTLSASVHVLRGLLQAAKVQTPPPGDARLQRMVSTETGQLVRLERVVPVFHRRLMDTIHLLTLHGTDPDITQEEFPFDCMLDAILSAQSQSLSFKHHLSFTLASSFNQPYVHPLRITMSPREHYMRLGLYRLAQHMLVLKQPTDRFSASAFHQSEAWLRCCMEYLSQPAHFAMAAQLVSRELTACMWQFKAVLLSVQPVEGGSSGASGADSSGLHWCAMCKAPAMCEVSCPHDYCLFRQVYCSKNCQVSCESCILHARPC